MTRAPQIALLADGRRLHLQDGPIDLIVEARGSEANVRTAYGAAVQRFTGLLGELCEELPLLRQATDPARCLLRGTVARRMHEAVAPFASEHFITPMAAVAGSFLVSYTRAKAENLGLRGDVGIGSRAERVVVITAGLVLAPWGVLPWALVLLACTAWITVGQRVLHVRKQLIGGNES